ncbi:MAG: hypothetical protein ACREDZ_17560 [Kiloniellales bacterium]
MIFNEPFNPIQENMPESRSRPDRFFDEFDRRSRLTLFAFLIAIGLLIGAAVAL